MSHDDQLETGEAAIPEVSRRGLIGAAAAIGAGAVVALGASSVSAAPPRAEVLGAVTSGLTYVGIDGLAFFSYVDVGPVEGRVFDELTGAFPYNLPTSRRIGAPLMLPVGSVIHQLNISYQRQPIVEIHRRDLANPNPSTLPFQLTTVMGSGPTTQTFDLATPITVDQGATFSIQMYMSAGDGIFGVTVGYLPPTQSFQAFVGADPRVLNTRDTGGKLAPNEERVIPLGFPGARGAVLNVTVADTEGAGFIAVNRAGIPYPGNSSLNWSSSGQLLSNGVTTALDANGAIVIRGGANRTNVIIDRIGWLL